MDTIDGRLKFIERERIPLWVAFLYGSTIKSELRKYFFNFDSLTKLVSILKKLFRSYF